MSEKKDQEYYADGLTEELISRLSRAPDLKVIARTSSFQFKGKSDDTKLIGQKLRVAYLLEGSVRRSDETMRVTVQLIYASDGSHRWSRTYDRKPSNILEVQDEIAQTVAQELRVVLGRAPAKTEGGSTISDAYNQMLKGNFLLARFTREDTEGAIKAFQRAIQFDPTYAMGWARLSLAERRMAVQAWAPPAEAEARARRAVERALKIEPNLSMGLIAMHQIHLDFDWD
jgi:adenylate cyclase